MLYFIDNRIRNLWISYCQGTNDPQPREPYEERKPSMKRRYALILLMAAALGLTACQAKEEAPDAQSDGAADIQDIKDTEEAEEISSSDPILYKNLSSTIESLGEYKGLKATKNVAEVTDEDVKRQIQAAKISYAETIEVDRPAEEGDIVVIDFTGYVDGKTSDSLQGSDHPLELGSGQFVPGFEEQLIGASADSDVEVNVTFPTDYYEDMAGKEARFEVHVDAVKEYDGWNDSFVKKTLGYDSIAGMEASIRKDLEASAEEDAETALQSSLVEQLLAQCKFHIEESDVDAYVNQGMKQYEAAAQSCGMDLDSFLQSYMGATEEKMQESLSITASYRVQMTLAFHSIAQEENLTVSEEEYQSMLKDYASAYGYNDTAEVEAAVGRDLLMEQAEQEKVLDFILEHALVS